MPQYPKVSWRSFVRLMLGGTAAALLQGCGVASPLGQTSLPEVPRPGASRAPAGSTPSPTRALLQNENRPSSYVPSWPKTHLRPGFVLSRLAAGRESGSRCRVASCARHSAACPMLVMAHSGRNSHGFCFVSVPYGAIRRGGWPRSRRMRILGQDSYAESIRSRHPGR